VAELVEESSSFGTAGTLVVVCFGLFSRFGAARAATAGLLGGLAVYIGADLGGVPYPFITSVAGAVVLYLLAGVGEKARPLSAPAARLAGPAG
jgi:hypothetical protein